jgi:ParB family chromosome partitioning protein
MAKSGLGKGLGALISVSPALRAPEPGTGEQVQQVSLASIVPSPLQPRREFAREALEELVDSIRQRGIIQPLIVRPAQGQFELIAGERRWRAAKEVGLSEAPVIVRQASDLEVLELSLIENLQRADLNPIEEAQAYARLASEFGMSQEEIAEKVGKSRASVANAIRLLDLDQQIQTWVVQDLLSVGHAKVLLGIKSHDEQRLLAEKVLRQSSTVRTTERMVARHLGKLSGTRRRRRAETVSSAALSDLENRLRQHLATHVTIHHGEKRGRIEIEFYGSDDLERVVNALGLPPDA